MTYGARIVGLDEVQQMLSELLPKEAAKVAQLTVNDVAKEIAEEAKFNMPAPSGTMRRATHVTPEKRQGKMFSAAVRVAKSAFYWRFLEYGQGPDGVEHAFFLRAREKVMAKNSMRRLFIERLRNRLGV